MSSKRDTTFDGLRVIGLLAIILAHVNPPAILFQIRNFDVPLMVLASGAVYGLSSGTKLKYFSYVWGRVGRLLFPTWIFLSLFFAYYFFSSFLRGNPFPFPKETVIGSFELLSGIGYVWIIRIFILVALVLPFFRKLYLKTQSKGKYLLVLFLIYLFYESTYLFYSKTALIKNMPFINDLFQNDIFYILPFGCIAGLGLYLPKASTKTINLLLAGFVLVFLFLARVYDPNQFINTQWSKYPPQIYYLSYALSVSLLLYLLSKTIFLKKLFSAKPILFISTSSLWIYLWHIFFLFQWESLLKNINPAFRNYIGEYVFVVSLAILSTYLQKIIVKRLIQKLDKQTSLKEILTKSLL